MKLYVLKIGGEEYSALTLENNVGVCEVFEAVGSVPSHRIIYHVKDDYDEEWPCDCILNTYDMKNMEKSEMEKLLQKTLFNVLDYDESKNTNYHIRYSDHWNPEIEHDPLNKVFFRFYNDDNDDSDDEENDCDSIS